jgi:hypothetical protein
MCGLAKTHADLGEPVAQCGLAMARADLLTLKATLVARRATSRPSTPNCGCWWRRFAVRLGTGNVSGTWVKHRAVALPDQRGAADGPGPASGLAFDQVTVS